MRTWWLLVFALLGCPKEAPTSVRLTGDGFTVDVVAAPFSLKVIGADGVARLETKHGPRVTLDTFVIESQLVPGWDGYRARERPWRTFDTGVIETSDSKSVTMTFKDALGSVSLALKVDGSRVRWEQHSNDGKNSNTSGLAFVIPEGAHYFGMGQRTATFDHLGYSLYSWPEEGGLGAGEDAGVSDTNPYPNGPSMTYFPVPFFHSTHGVSVWLDSDFRNTVHFGNVPDEPGTVRLVANETSLAVTFYVRHQATIWDDVESQELYRTAAGLHTRLAPYFRALARDAHVTGAPITRSPVLLFPSLADAWKADDVFFVGPSLYAAPVVRRGVRTRRAWLPPGRFVEWSEGSVHAGPGFVEVPAPLGRLPLFVVENQLVPLLDAEVQTLAPSTVPGIVTEASRADVLDVVAALGPGGNASMTLADGTTLEAKRVATPVSTTCASCSVETFGGVRRVRVTGVRAFDDVEVSSSGSRQVRWQILELP